MREQPDKSALFATIISQLETAVQLAHAAADQARATATDKENIAENKYDTLGLEAAYLAHGQSERVVQLSQSLEDFKALVGSNQIHDKVEVGSLVSLEDEFGSARHVLIGPSAGGHKVSFAGMAIIVITVSSPLGQSLMNRAIDDEVIAEIAGNKTTYVISQLW